MPLFLPARFSLFEFDDSALPDQLAPPLRWLPSWQGPAHQPAEEVCLGWVGRQEQQAVVATAQLARHPDDQDRRHNAAFLVLGGDQLRRTASSSQPTPAHAAIQNLATRADAWELQEVIVDGRVVQAHRADVDEHTFCGYFAVSERLGFFAAVGLKYSDMRVRTLSNRSAAAYPVDPVRPIGLDVFAQLRRPAHK